MSVEYEVEIVVLNAASGDNRLSAIMNNGKKSSLTSEQFKVDEKYY
jgi:archaellum component FlaG (FlaF/FlaG flagellin family)